MPATPDLKPPRMKRPNEILPATVQFAAEIPSGDTAASHVVTASLVSDGSDVTGDLIADSALSGSDVSAKIQAGEDGEDYDVRFRCVTTAGYAFEHVLRLGVRD